MEITETDSELARLGGEETIGRWMALFYEKIGEHPLLAPMFPSLAESREKQIDYMVEFLGGPKRYTEKHGKAFLRFKHRHVKIGQPERDAWLALFLQTLREITDDPAMIEQIEARIAPIATAMINHRPEKEDSYYFN